MADIHPAPGPVAQDVMATPGPLATEDLTAACEAAVSTAQDNPGQASPGMGNQYV